MAAQLALYEKETPRTRPVGRTQPVQEPRLCTGCCAKEARYGFREDKDDPRTGRPRTLCFECFRVEIGRRQTMANARQTRLPLDETLESLSRRRRRAQMNARHVLEASGG